MTGTTTERRRQADTLEDSIEILEERLLAIERAFPDGPEPHRASHVAMIRAAEAQERFYNELKLDVVKKGTWGLLVIVIGLVLTGVFVSLGAKLGVVSMGVK